MEKDSVFTRRRRLFDFILIGSLSKEIVDQLLPEGKPHEYEKQLWDYKEELPALPLNVKPSKQILDEFNYKISEIIKDAVSFYNSFGGYLLVGVSDHPRTVVGFKKEFDCDELNKRIKAVTGHEVDCHYAKHDINVNCKTYKIGLLYIPRRPDGMNPAQFVRSSPVSKAGRKAFNKSDIYFREGSESKPAKSSEDFSFLCSQDCRQISLPDSYSTCIIIDNNLGERDPGFIKFIGREKYLADLWRWLFDKYAPIKLLTGLGGVGKTTLAREFTEEFIRSAPINFERVVWLSAKQQFFTSILGEYKPTTRVDFYDLKTLLLSILKEIGWPAEQIDKEWTREELIENVIETLTEIPVFLIVDDIDSLDLLEQHDVFQTISLILGQTIGRSEVASRALLTARLDLGAAPNQFFVVKGLNFKEFTEYVDVASMNIGLKLDFEPKSKLMKKYHQVTDGSPTFANSILRLLATGDNLNSVLNKWKGSSGEEVRKFAFQKELKNLTESQHRTLYAGCILGETSLLELRQIILSNETLLKDDISELKQYHLVSLGSELPTGGSRLIVPNSIRLMTDLIKDKIQDPKRIERECARFRAGTPKFEDNVGMVIHRVIALWKTYDYEEALEVARWGNNKYKDNADLKCLLGRTYMNLDPPKPRYADKMFRRAFELNCRRPELYEIWINAKIQLKDWIGLIDVTKVADEKSSKPSHFFLRIEAYGKIAASAKTANNLPLAAEYFYTGGKEINLQLKTAQYISRKNDLLEFRDIYFKSYVQVVDEMASTSRNYIETWLAVHDVYKSNYFSKDLFFFGIGRLENWWETVLSRKTYEYKAKNLFEIQIDRISKIANKYLGKNHFSKNEAAFVMERLDFLKNLIIDYKHSDFV